MTLNELINKVRNNNIEIDSIDCVCDRKYYYGDCYMKLLECEVTYSELRIAWKVYNVVLYCEVEQKKDCAAYDDIVQFDEYLKSLRERIAMDFK